VDLFSVEGKRVLVSGGASGIGEMLVRGFVDAGARVYLASRKREACEALASELSTKGHCVGLGADLSTEEGCIGLEKELGQHEQELDVLINNSGANWGAPYEEFPDSAWDKVMALNVKGVFHLTRCMTPRLRAASKPGDPSRVINIGSIDGIQVPALETYSYSASKAAVHQLSRVLAKKLAPDITVNVVAPGPFQSKMMKATLEAAGDALAKSMPMKRIGEPDDMAGAAIFLASRAGAFVTGAILPVDGGMATTR